MAPMAPFAESDFDSIHSSQAFVGDHQVMYTPPLRIKKPSRFASTQSYILPDIPNTSQIVGGGAGELPRMRTSSNENQIVTVLTRMQKQLDQAKTTIRELMRERDEYRGEAKMLRQILAQTQCSKGHKVAKDRPVEELDDDLLDFTRDQEVDDDFTQQLPTLNIAKNKSSLKPTTGRAPMALQRPSNPTTTADIPTPRALQKQAVRPQQTEPPASKRPPLRELSESIYQQRSQQNSQKPGKKVVIEEDDNARDANHNNTIPTKSGAPTRNITYLTNLTENQPFTALRNQLEAERLNRLHSSAREPNSNRQDTGRSTRAATAPPLEHEPIAILEDKELTAPSNTSRRRRRASDTGETDHDMTASAFLLPDLTLARPQAQQETNPPIEEHIPPSTQWQPGQLSDEAKDFLHSVDPDHIVSCVHCRRLLRLPEKLQVRREAAGWDWCMVLGDR